MKYIKPMNCSEFAQYLLTLKNGDTVEFACDPGVNWPDEVPDVTDVECWYFARVMVIPEYESRFILIDYCGGEEAFAIPLNCYSDRCDMDDHQIVPDFVEEYFKGHCRNLDSINDFVFVEMEDEEE